MEWLLTGEEMSDIATLDIAVLIPVTANAQARKLVEWMEDHEHKEGLKAMFYFCVTRDDWQDLRKAVGL